MYLHYTTCAHSCAHVKNKAAPRRHTESETMGEQVNISLNDCKKWITTHEAFIYNAHMA